MPISTTRALRAIGTFAAAALLVSVSGCGDRSGAPEAPGGPASPASPLAHPGAPPASFTPPSSHAPAGGGNPYAATIEEERQRKDAYFRDSPDSPVPAGQRASFPPLEYYPVDPLWRMTLAVEPYARRQTFELVTNLGERRVFRREGQVHFAHEGAAVSLQLYREIEDSGEAATLWVPFTDAGAGRETYPAGRYMDVTPNDDGTVTLDFNRAYNPYCAYGWAFSCPMAPPENRLRIAVRAGEKGFHHP